MTCGCNCWGFAWEVLAAAAAESELKTSAQIVRAARVEAQKLRSEASVASSVHDRRVGELDARVADLSAQLELARRRRSRRVRTNAARVAAEHARSMADDE